MKNIILLVTLFVCTSTFAQNITDTIGIRRNFFTTTYRYGNEKINLYQVWKITKMQPLAAKETKTSKTFFIFQALTSAVGTVLIVSSSGTVGTETRTDYSRLPIGLSLWAMSGILSTQKLKHIKRAIGIFNENVSSKSVGKLKPHVGVTANGVGMIVQF